MSTDSLQQSLNMLKTRRKRRGMRRRRRRRRSSSRRKRRREEEEERERLVQLLYTVNSVNIGGQQLNYRLY